MLQNFGAFAPIRRGTVGGQILRTAVEHRKSARRKRRGACLLLSFVITVCLSSTAMAQTRIDVAVIRDGDPNRLETLQQSFVDELMLLTASEFDLRIKPFSGAWTKQSIEEALENAYADADIDLVLVSGFVANQLAATRQEFPKPTFLPLLLDAGLVAGEPQDGTSGVENLNYLSAYSDFGDDLDILTRITPYRSLTLFVDDELASTIPRLREASSAASAQRGIELNLVTHDGVDHRLMNRVLAGTEAIFLAGLPRMPPDAFKELVDAINSAGLASYSFLGVEDVERGLLATSSEPRDTDRQARLNALNMQAVMLGGKASRQPVAAQERRRITINMATARTIDVSPSFDVLSNAVILNQDVEASGPEFGLVEIARAAIEENQDLRAEAFGVQAGFEEISFARGNLLPQVGISSSYTTRKESPSVTAGVLAERTSDAALSVDQLIYSDAASANLKIQKELQRVRRASLQQFRLDVVQAATTAYYQVLNARSQLSVQDNNLRITRANLELAETRVRLGSSTAADIYRWQAQVARAQIQVFDARATLNQSWDTLNRILHRPQGTQISLKEASFNEPFVMTREEFDQIVERPRDFTRFMQFYIERALQQAPELEQLDAQIAAKRRELVNYRRAYWLPDFTIGGRYNDNLSQFGTGAGLSAGEGLNDWSFGVQATLPIFSGGQKRSNVSRAGYEVQQLMSLRSSTAERVEEQVRLQMYASQASYAQIDLAAVAAEASRKNFDLVSEAYAAGTLSIIDLLDAQDASLVANATAAESLYGFLITIMSVQRAVGGYDYLLSPEARNALAAEYRMAITGSER